MASVWCAQVHLFCASLTVQAHSDRPSSRAAGFAEARLQKGGRCHESEIWKAFEGEHPEFRLEENKIPEQFCRDMVVNWFPQAQRSAAGFYKNVSLRPRSDPFTGETTGVDLSTSGRGST